MATWHVVTGGAGFIGSNLVRTLTQRGGRVRVVDDLSLGRPEHLDDPDVLRVTDASNPAELAAAVADLPDGDVELWHLCANSDIRAGSADPRVDLNATFLTTFAVLEVMRARGWTSLNFASTSAVYGDHRGRAVAEDAPTIPISNYGAMKLASEAAINAAAESFLKVCRIFRFPNVVGLPCTHGVILDFVRRLHTEPEQLTVLGDGTQQKPYLHADELVAAMLFIQSQTESGRQLFNIGPADDGVSVAEIARLVCERVSPSACIAFGSEPRGWVGDVPRVRYDVSRLAALGWTPSLDSAGAVRRAVDEIASAIGAGA